jgi:PPOX class probable F420-dependent enzyme
MPKPEIPEHVSQLLAKPNPAVVGTIGPTGAPVTVATWYLWEDGRVLLNMDAGRRRLQHLRADPRVSLTVLDSESWYRHISLRGRITTLEDDPDLVDIDKLARHYTGKQYPVRDRARVSGWMDIERWHAWNID